MDEKIQYQHEPKSLEDMSSQWQVRFTSTMLDNLSSTSFQQQDAQRLIYTPQAEFQSKRPIIPASWHEQLTYFRNYASTLCKRQIVCMEHVEFNRFLWNYVFNLIFKSIPHNFVYMFLALYAAEEHFFVKNMLPICSGLRISNIIAGILDITFSVGTLIKLLDYAISGLVYKNPWNRCVDIKLNLLEFPVKCYEFDDFAKKFINETPVFNNSYYVSSDEENFQLAPLLYYPTRQVQMNDFKYSGYQQLLYFGLIWLILDINQKAIFKKCFWRAMHYIQMTIVCIYVLVTLHLTTMYIFSNIERITEVRNPQDQQTLIFLETADIDMLAESMVTPPVVHLITARSTHEIEPSRDSALMVLSNAIYYIFRAVISDKVKKYCEALVKTPLYFANTNMDSMYYFWPIYFSTFYLGNLYTIVFFMTHFLVELLTLIVTFDCFVEAIVCDWKVTERLNVIVILTFVSTLWFFISTEDIRIFTYVFTIGLVTACEVAAIYVMYPVGRLIEDITFFSGTMPPKLWMWSLTFVPFYYVFKLFFMVLNLRKMSASYQAVSAEYMFYLCCALMFTPIVFGAMYSVYDLILAQKKSFASLFRPVRDLGPEYEIRQLRKMYDMRTYIGSQAPRMLSRYMINKAESKAHNINVRYDRRSSQMNARPGMQAENKYTA